MIAVHPFPQRISDPVSPIITKARVIYSTLRPALWSETELYLRQMDPHHVSIIQESDMVYVSFSCCPMVKRKRGLGSLDYFIVSCFRASKNGAIDNIYLQASICRLNYRPVNALYTTKTSGTPGMNRSHYLLSVSEICLIHLSGVTCCSVYFTMRSKVIWEYRHAGTTRRGHSCEYRGKGVSSMLSQADYVHSVSGHDTTTDGSVCSDCKLQPSPSPMTLGLRLVTRDETRKHWAQRINWAVWLVLILVIAL